MSDYTLFVEGEPFPQGSKTAINIGGKCRVIESKGTGNAKHKKWRKTVADEATKIAQSNGWMALDGPIGVTLTFHMHKPPSRPKGDVLVYVKPDLDKLCRSVLDSITGVLIVEDSRVSELNSKKVYALDGRSGVEITIRQLTHGAPSLFD